jgi:WD40 repeat protein
MFVALVPCNTLAAQVTRDSTISRDQPIVVLERHRAGITSVKFSPDGAVLASADLSGRIILWRTSDWTPIRSLSHGSEVYAVAFSPDGATLASTGGDFRVRLWNVGSGRQMRMVATGRRPPSIVFAPDGTLLIGTEDGTVHFVDPASGAETRTLKTGGGPALVVAVSPDGSTLATALPIRVWDLHTLNKRFTLQSLGQLGLAFSSDGRKLCSAESTGGALLWTLGDSASSLALRATVEKRAVGVRGYESFPVNMPVAAIDVSGDAKVVIGGGTTGLVYIWRPSGPEPPAPLELAGHAMTVTAVALSPTRALAASGSLDRTIRIWKIEADR